MNTSEKNLTDCELMLFGLTLVFAVITQSHIWLWKNHKCVTKVSACVTSKPKLNQSKTQTQWATFSFKYKTQLVHDRQMTQVF